MLCYRVCSRIEANYQKLEWGKWWQPPGEKVVFNIDEPGLYVTLFPEYWRRGLNREAASLGTGVLWDHTLLLEVPEDYLEEQDWYFYKGLSYRLETKADALIRGIAGPTWLPPDWVPQPNDEKEWNVRGQDYTNPSICYWTPRGVDPKSLWYHPTQDIQKGQCRRFNLRKMMGLPMSLDRPSGEI
jgi:hypothetical protein